MKHSLCWAESLSTFNDSPAQRCRTVATPILTDSSCSYGLTQRSAKTTYDSSDLESRIRLRVHRDLAHDLADQPRDRTPIGIVPVCQGGHQ